MDTSTKKITEFGNCSQMLFKNCQYIIKEELFCIACVADGIFGPYFFENNGNTNIVDDSFVQIGEIGLD